MPAATCPENRSTTESQVIDGTQILTLAEAVEIVPLSEKTLRRVAQRGEGPFLKLAGRWMVYEDDLHRWVRSHGAPVRAGLGSGDKLAERVRRRREDQRP